MGFVWYFNYNRVYKSTLSQNVSGFPKSLKHTTMALLKILIHFHILGNSCSRLSLSPIYVHGTWLGRLVGSRSVVARMAPIAETRKWRKREIINTQYLVLLSAITLHFVISPDIAALLISIFEAPHTTTWRKDLAMGNKSAINCIVYVHQSRRRNNDTNEENIIITAHTKYVD